MPLPKCARVLEDDTQSREALEADGWRYVETLVEMKRETEHLNHDAKKWHGDRDVVGDVLANNMGPNRLHRDGATHLAAEYRYSIALNFKGEILTIDGTGFLLRDGNRLALMAVDGSAKRRGQGMELVKGFITHAWSEGYDEVFLGTQENNDAALALYGRLGFRTYCRRVTYHKD